jgi:hypothetical protein
MHFLTDGGWECRLRFSIANGGDTDATVIGYLANLYWQVEPRFFDPERGEGRFNFLNNVTIKPGQRSEVNDTHLYNIQGQDFSTDSRDAIRKERLFAIGRVEYEGADGTRRVTGFCREYDFVTRMWQTVKNDAYEYTY